VKRCRVWLGNIDATLSIDDEFGTQIALADLVGEMFMASSGQPKPLRDSWPSSQRSWLKSETRLSGGNPMLS